MGSFPTGSSYKDLFDQDGCVQCGKNAALKYKPLSETIGKDVYKGKFQDIPVAVRKTQRSGKMTERDVPNEVEILKGLNHENIIRYKFHDFDEHGFLYLAIELFVSDIGTYLDSQPDPLPYRIDMRQDIKKHFIKDIANGLHYLHGKGIIHCDLKPKNILLKDSGCVQRVDNVSMVIYTAVISDFRMCNIEGRDSRPFSNKDEHKIIDGWKPKEIIEKFEKKEDLSWTKKADIFSFGCIVHNVMITDRTSEDKDFFLHPFGGVKRIKRIKDNNRASYVSIKNSKKRLNFTLNDILADMLVSICVDENTQCRPNTEELANHPFFWDAKSRYKFIENIANNVNHFESSESLKENLQEQWDKYFGRSYEVDVPEAVKYFKEEYYEAMKAKDESFKPRSSGHHYRIVNLVGDIRNMKQHYPEIVEASRNKENGPLHITAFLNEGLDEDFDRYFIQKIKPLLPIVYTWCLYDVPRAETKAFLDNISKTENEEEIHIRKEVYWNTLKKIFDTINKTDSKKRARSETKSTSNEGSPRSWNSPTGSRNQKKRRGK